MFEILPSPSLETILMVLCGALLVGAFWVFALAFIRWRRADEQDAQRLHGRPAERQIGASRTSALASSPVGQFASWPGFVSENVTPLS